MLLKLYISLSRHVSGCVTSSVELCFRLISPVDYPYLYRLVVHKSCDLLVPRCELCGPHFLKNVDFVVHIFLIWVTNLKMAAMLPGSPHIFMLTPWIVHIFMWTASGLHCFGPLVVHVWFFGVHILLLIIQIYSLVKVMKKWLIVMVLPLLICHVFNVWYMDQWFHSNYNNINKVQIQCSNHQEYKS